MKAQSPEFRFRFLIHLVIGFAGMVFWLRHAVRTSLGAAVCVLTLLAALMPVQTETPPSVLVLAQSIDDAVSLDPAEVFELTTVQFSNNPYQRLVRADRLDATDIRPALAASWDDGSSSRSAADREKPALAFSSEFKENKIGL